MVYIKRIIKCEQLQIEIINQLLEYLGEEFTPEQFKKCRFWIFAFTALLNIL